MTRPTHPPSILYSAIAPPFSKKRPCIFTIEISGDKMNVYMVELIRAGVYVSGTSGTQDRIKKGADLDPHLPGSSF